MLIGGKECSQVTHYSMKTLGGELGEVGFAGPMRDVLRIYRQLTFARGWIGIPELTGTLKNMLVIFK